MKKTFLLLCLGLSGFAGFAQGSSSLSLPFFDDFARFDNRLDTTKWEKGSTVYINNHFSRNPLTKNIATFNGVSAAGNLHPIFSGQQDGVDTLTSLPINLAGFNPADSVQLSFFLQTGGLTLPSTPLFASNRPRYIQVEFKNNNNVWQAAPGGRINAPTAAQLTKAFKQYFFAITATQYLHSNFQFRIRSFGNPTLDFETWNLDYVYLNSGRRRNERRIDVATSRKVGSVLQRYTAMPIHQFQANVAGELNDSVYTTLNNLEDQPRAITSTSTVQIGNAGPVTFASKPIALNAFARQYNDFPDSPNPAVFSGITGFQDIKATVFVETQEQAAAGTLYNDTISSVTQLRDYYAYDDGSPENIINIQRTSPGFIYQLAQRFFLNQNDQVKRLTFFLPKSNNTPGTVATFRIWNVKPNGEPEDNSIFSATYTVPPIAQLDTWVNIPVNPPVQVSGSFYAGWTIPSGSANFSVGLDQNNNAPRYYKTNNASGFQNEGAVMLRVFMGNHITSIAENSTAKEVISIYPNPAKSRVMVRGAAEVVRVFTLTGQQVLEKTVTGAETELDVSKLSPGLYLVQTQKESRVQTQKLIIQPN